MSVAAWLASGARHLVRDYRINWIYSSPSCEKLAELPRGLTVRALVPADFPHIASSPDAQVRKAGSYAHDMAAGWVLVGEGAGLLAVAHFVGRERYAHASTWPLGDDQLALVDIVVFPAARGQGHATRLIVAATPLALASGARTDAICFIWWNHRASLRAFRRAGWRAVGLSIELVTRSGRLRCLRAEWPGRATVR